MVGEPPFLGRGWAFPPTFSPGGGDVDTVAGAEDVVQSLHILFATALGERPMRETFGANLNRYVFAAVDHTMVSDLRGALTDAILTWEPRITLTALEVTESDDTPGLLLISVHYGLRGTNSRYNLVYPYYVREATAVKR